MIRVWFVLAGVLVAAAEGHGCTLLAKDVHAPAPPPTVTAAAIYLTLENPCETDLTVTGARGPSGRQWSIHRTTVEDGIARMEAVDALRLAPRGRLVFEPGGLHVMVHGGELEAGTELAFELRLEGGPPTPVKARLTPTASRSDGHEHHAHH